MSTASTFVHQHLFIGGEWVSPATEGIIEVIDPATECAIGSIPAGNQADVNSAVSAAREAFDHGPWPRMTGVERAAILRQVASKIREHAPELAYIEVKDSGKPLPEAEWDMGDAAGTFDYFARLAEADDKTNAEQVALADSRFFGQVLKEPLGVIASITPWNYPLLMAAWKLAPALAAGCTVVLKPSEFTSLTALALCNFFVEAGLPKGAANIVTGTGGSAGQPLINHDGVDKISFTGSVPTGSKVMAAAAPHIKKVSLELGGKSPMIVFEDADIDNAVEWIAFGIFWNQGQVCSATSRVLIHEAIYDVLVAKVVKQAKEIRIGGGLDVGTKLGPLVSYAQYHKVLAAIQNAQVDGARILTGGGRPAGLHKGYFVEPTVLCDVPLKSSAWTDEIFGPVLCVRKFSSEAEAIELANNSEYGLAASVLTQDEQRAARVVRAMKAGVTWINCSQPAFNEMPWGGYKRSGIGREMGRWGFESYQEVKQVLGFRKGERWGWYSK